MRAEGRPPSTTRDALRELGERGLLGGHPKVEQTVAAVIDAVGRGEKTLVFVEREKTGEELQRRINAELEKQKADDLSSDEAQLQAFRPRRGSAGRRCARTTSARSSRPLSATTAGGGH